MVSKRHAAMHRWRTRPHMVAGRQLGLFAVFAREVDGDCSDKPLILMFAFHPDDFFFLNWRAWGPLIYYPPSEAIILLHEDKAEICRLLAAECHQHVPSGLLEFTYPWLRPWRDISAFNLERLRRCFLPSTWVVWRWQTSGWASTCPLPQLDGKPVHEIAMRFIWTSAWSQVCCRMLPGPDPKGQAGEPGPWKT